MTPEENFASEPVIDLASLEPEVGPLVEFPEIRPIAYQRESMRGILAAAMVGVFAVIVLSATVAALAGTHADQLKSLLEVILPPVVALTGTVVGFYFGGQDQSTRP